MDDQGVIRYFFTVRKHWSRYEIIHIDLRLLTPLLPDVSFLYPWKHQKAKRFSVSDNNGIRTYNHLVRERTLNHLAELASWLN